MLAYHAFKCRSWSHYSKGWGPGSQKDYKTFSPNVDWDNVDWGSAPAIQETNVQSAIVEPKPGSILEGPLDEVEVRGFAYSGGGRGIMRVDVSPDGGKTWTTASLHPVDSNLYRHGPRSGNDLPDPRKRIADPCLTADLLAFRCPHRQWGLKGFARAGRPSCCKPDGVVLLCGLPTLQQQELGRHSECIPSRLSLLSVPFSNGSDAVCEVTWDNVCRCPHHRVDASVSWVASVLRRRG